MNSGGLCRSNHRRKSPVNVEAMLQELDGYFQRKEIARVEPFLLARLSEASAANDGATGLTILNELMGFYRGMSRFQESITAAHQALRLLDMLGQQGTASHATTLLNVATAYRAGGQTAKAIAQYEEVMAIYRTLKVDDAALVASLYNNLSLAWQEVNKHEKAIHYLQMALPLVRDLDNSDMLASTLTNLATSELRCGRLADARRDLANAVRLFESQAITNSHFGAALAGLGEVAYREGRHQEAISHYERALADIESHYGRNAYYAVTEQSLALVREASAERGVATTPGRASVSVPLNASHDLLPTPSPCRSAEGPGLTLARNYYRAHSERLFAPYVRYRSRIAAGLVGFGSECFGYDDEFSRDHDFGPGFCIWLSDVDYATFGAALQADYDALPKSFGGFPARRVGPRSGRRVGVFAIGEFYSQFLGAPELAISDADWLQIPEERLAAAVNGEIFEDGLGEFTRTRNSLQHYYPTSIRRLKIAEAVARMAQSGQYNLPRALQREDMPTALLAQAEFIRHSCCLVHAINGKYAPFYKWLHRGIRDVALLSGLYEKIGSLGRMSARDAPPVIEDICADVLNELIAQGYTVPGDSFLEAHVDAILDQAPDRPWREQEGWP
jgi:tetratricopeptide (TPR) repeat protein